MRAAERRAKDLLERSELRPGSAPSAIVRALGYSIYHAPKLPPGVSGMCDPENSTILLAPCSYRPRWEFSCGHEALELNLPNGIPAEHKEAYCDRGAAALAMPVDAFLKSGTACDWELRTLAAWWPFCSPLSILRRVTDLMDGSRVTAFARSRMRLCIESGDTALPEHVGGLEAFTASEALHGSGRSEVALSDVRVRAWRTGAGRAVTLSLLKTVAA